MKILLVLFPSMAESDILLEEQITPLSIYALAASIRYHSHEVELIDPNQFVGMTSGDAVSSLKNRICKDFSDIVVIGFSTNSFNWAITRSSIISIKEEFQHITIIAGGLHASVFDKYIISSTPIDYIIRGEGELSVCKLLDHLQTGQPDLIDIEGLTCMKNNSILRNKENMLIPVKSFSKLPLPAYDLVPDSKYLAIPVETSRGCKYSCSFCSIPHRHMWRGLDVDSVLQRVDHAKGFIRKFANGKVINFTDDCFTEDAERAVCILKSLENKKDGCQYFIEARISNLLRNNLVYRLNPNIISQMQIGVECGYDEGLRRIRKGLTIRQLYQCVSDLKSTGLNKVSFLSFIIGFPWEGSDEILQTLKTMEDIACNYQVLCNINWLLFLPSDLWNQRYDYRIDVNESLYDRFSWHSYTEYFYRCHPKITKPLYNAICKKLIDMESQCEHIKTNIPLFYY